MRFSVSKGELVLALVFAGLGGLWIARAARMSLWEGFAPDSGFLPLVYGVVLTALALLAAVRSFAAPPAAAAGDLRKPLLVLAALTAAVAALPFAGFAISVFALIFFLYAALERLPPLFSIAVSGVTTGVLYLVFKTWLGVPLP